MLQITELELVNNNRLGLLSSNIFKHTFDKQYTAIGGINGAGKSTILNELSPLPANMSDYDADGYKKITLQKDEDTYVLTSSGSRPGKHSFLLNGNELNPGGTMKVQYSLVEEHFNYTPKTHQVLIGKRNLSIMSPAERQQWFADISGMDNDFISKFWNLIKGGLRDNTGALKNINHKIADTSLQMMKEEDLNHITELHNTYAGVLGGLIDLKKKFEQPFPAAADMQHEHDFVLEMKKINEDSNYHYHKLVSAVSERFDFSKASDNITQYTRDSQRLLEERTQLEEKIQRVNDALREYQTDEEINVPQLERDIEDCNTKIQRDIPPEIPGIYDKLKAIFPGTNLTRRLSSIYMTHNNNLRHIDDALLEMKPASLPYRQLKEQYQLKFDELKSMQHRADTLSTMIDNNTKTIMSIDNEHNKETCPQCKHVFTRDKVRHQLDDILKSNQTMIDEIEPLKEKIGQLDKEVSLMKLELDNYRIVLEFVRDDESGLIQYFLNSYSPADSVPKLMREIAYNPRSFVGSFQKWIENIRPIMAYAELVTARDLYQAQLDKGMRLKSTEYITLNEKLKFLKHQHKDVNKRYSIANHQITRTRSSMKAMETYLNELSGINEQVDRLYVKANNIFKREWDNALEEMIKLVLEKADDINRQIKYQSGVQFLIKSYEENRRAVEVAIDDHKELMKILDPKTGLIAKSLIGFIRHFVRNMNNLVEQIWQYPMAIEIEEDDDFTKDYRFPVRVSEHLRDDVSTLSLGQTDIMDIAFRITLYSHLGMKGFPLLLDEAGSSLSVSHRAGFFNLVKRLVEHGYFSQVFFITHLIDVKDIIGSYDNIELS